MPREYELTFPAATALDAERQRAFKILENLAVSHAATDPGRDPSAPEVIVNFKHVKPVKRAVEKLREYAESEEASISPDAHPVFISYSNKNVKFAKQLADQLNAKQLTCFLADQSIPPGAEWSRQIWTALRQCRVVVLLITAQSVSDWCKYEIGAALALNKTIVPAVRVGGLQPPGILHYIESRDVHTFEEEASLVRSLVGICRSSSSIRRT
jgi:hypothetical protein